MKIAGGMVGFGAVWEALLVEVLPRYAMPLEGKVEVMVEVGGMEVVDNVISSDGWYIGCIGS